MTVPGAAWADAGRAGPILELDDAWKIYDLGEVVVEALAPFQARMKELQADKTYTLGVLKDGAERAEAIAERTMQKVHERMGIVPRS